MSVTPQRLTSHVSTGSKSHKSVPNFLSELSLSHTFGVSNKHISKTGDEERGRRQIKGEIWSK